MLRSAQYVTKEKNKAMSNAFVYAATPLRSKGGSRIPAEGYCNIFALIPCTPCGGVRPLHVVRAVGLEQGEDFRVWRRYYSKTIGQYPNLTVVHNSDPERNFFEALLNDPNALTSVRNRIAQGALFRPFTWNALMDGYADKIGVPISQRYNRCEELRRVQWEIDPTDLLEAANIPDDLVRLRIMAPGSKDSLNARAVVERLRGQGFQGEILLDIEDRPGGGSSLRIPPGAQESLEITNYFRDHDSQNLLITQEAPHEWVEWSSFYEGEELLGMNRQLFTTEDRARLHYASFMSLGKVDGIPMEQISLFQDEVAQPLRIEMGRQGYQHGSAGFVARMFQGKHQSPLYRLDIRDQSETPPLKLLRYLADIGHAPTRAYHSRWYWRRYISFADILHILEHLLYTPEREHGIILHVPYPADKYGGSQTILMVAVGTNEQQLVDESKEAARLLDAWAPGEKPR